MPPIDQRILLALPSKRTPVWPFLATPLPPASLSEFCDSPLTHSVICIKEKLEINIQQYKFYRIIFKISIFWMIKWLFKIMLKNNQQLPGKIVLEIADTKKEYI